MARVTKEQLLEELKQKHLELVSDYNEYKNINSPFTVKCIKGHIIETNLKTIRSSSFTCPICIGQATKGFKDEPIAVPDKKGYRIVSFDNSSHNIGVSIFDGGKLVYYGVFRFTEGSAIQRISKIRDMLEIRILPVWEPDFIQMEDVQLQQGQFKTYETLIKALGIFEIACSRFKIPYDKARSSVWRSHFGINKKKRNLEKKLAIELVKKMYDIEVNDDVAEAILIGKYRADIISRNQLEDLF